MNNYQKKRITGCLRRRKSLSDVEVNFLLSIKDKPDALSSKQNHILNLIAQRVGG